MAEPSTFVLYTRPDCKLCDRLRQMIQPYLDQHHLTLGLRDIDADRHWYETYRLRIPVLTHQDQVILEGHPTPEQVDRVMKQFKA